MSRNVVSPAQLRALVGEPGKRSKYGNRRGVYVAEIDRKFDSQREANVAVELLRRQQNGEIRGLRFQVTYSLDVKGVHVCGYRADFVYEDVSRGVVRSNPPVVVADAKGFRTAEYRLKRKLMKAIHGVEILEL